MRGFFLMALVLCLLVSPVSAQSPEFSFEVNPSASEIEGLYYFKGFRLLEVRRDGNEVYTQLIHGGLPAEAAVPFPAIPGSHRGRLLDKNTVEFANFPWNAENVMKALGVDTSQIPPDATAEFNQQFGKASGTYAEHWVLLEDGNLQIKCTIPITRPGFGTEKVQTLEALKETITGERPFGQYTETCGWKLTDPNEAKGWQALEKNDFTAAAGLFTEATKAQPASPFPPIGAALAFTGLKEFARAQKALDMASQRVNEKTLPYLEPMLPFLYDQVHSYRVAQSGNDFLAWTETIKGQIPMETSQKVSEMLKQSGGDLNNAQYQEASQLVGSFPYWEAVGQAAGLEGRGPLLPLSQQLFEMERWVNIPVPNFLDLQYLGKWVNLRALLERQSGVTQSIRTHSMAVRMGQMMEHGVLISYLIGVSIKTSSLDYIADLLEAGRVSDPDSIAALNQMSSFLYGEDSSRNAAEECMSYEIYMTAAPFEDPLVDGILSAIAVPNFLEAKTRVNAARARVYMLQAAANLKSQHATGPYPKSPDGLDIPTDPFVEGRPLHYISGTNHVTIYTVGPDQTDDKGTVVYDPTNGTVSRGDIAWRVR